MYSVFIPSPTWAHSRDYFYLWFGGRNINNIFSSHNFPHSPLFRNWKWSKIFVFKILQICFLLVLSISWFNSVSTDITFQILPYMLYDHVNLHSVRRSQIYFTQIAFLLFSCVCIHRFHCHWNFSYFPPVSAPTGSTATRTFHIQNFVQLLHVNMYSTKATNFVWYLERLNLSSLHRVLS